jgi:transcriptional regulator with XRE-family HTH domain
VYNPQEIAARIKNTAAEKGIALKTLLSECGLGINTVSKIAAGTDILTMNFVKIADRLDVSIDYLVGRTDDPVLH